MSGFMRKVKVKEIEEARQKFINGGGLVLADVEKQVEELSQLDEWIKINLRIRKEAINQIDKLIAKRMGVNRTSWILRAIEEKLERELAESKKV